MEAPFAVTNTWGRMGVSGGGGGPSPPLICWPSREADTQWQQLPISADTLGTGESVKYNQVDSDELTHWKIERFSNRPKDLISTTFFSFVQIHWKAYFSKFTSYWWDLSSLRCFPDWIRCHRHFGWLCEAAADSLLVSRGRGRGARV